MRALAMNMRGEGDHDGRLNVSVCVDFVCVWYHMTLRTPTYSRKCTVVR